MASTTSHSFAFHSSTGVLDHYITSDLLRSSLATMTKIIKKMLPAEVRVARDALDLLIDCCGEFINLVCSESNEVCNKEDKRTIAPEHVLKALQFLNQEEYVKGVDIYVSIIRAYASYNEETKPTTSKDEL